MTRISTVHGMHQIPTDEYAGRGAQLNPSEYVPYLSLTQGEMYLWLAAQRVKLLADWYGNDAPQYRQAAQMISNALNAGVSNGVHFVGAVPDFLQSTAQMIKAASRQTKPASKAGINARSDIRKGIGVIPAAQRNFECLKAAGGDIIKQKKCLRQFKKEDIINQNLVGMSPHMLYKNIPKGLRIPSDVETHRTLHRLGVEGIAGVAEITDYPLMYQWIENGILQKNMQSGAGPIGSVEGSFYLAPNPDEWIAKLKKTSGDKWNAISGARVGIAPVVLAAIVTVVTAAIGAAFAYLSEIRKTEILAMSEARGFGTPEFSANKNQWLGPADTTAGGPDMATMLMIGAGLWLLAGDNN